MVGRSGSSGRGRPTTAAHGHVGRRVEAEALEQDGVGHEAQEVGQVGRPAPGQVGEGLGDDAGGDGGQGGQLGVDGGLAAEGEEGDAGGEAPLAQLVEGLLPRRPPLEQADEHGPGPVEVGDGRVGAEADAAVGPDGREPVGQVLHRRPQGEQVEVVVGDHEDHGATRLPSLGRSVVTARAGQGRLKCHQFGGSSPRTACRRRPTSSTTGSRWCGGSPSRSRRRGRARRDGRWRRWRRRPGPAAAGPRRPCPPRPGRTRRRRRRCRGGGGGRWRGGPGGRP